MTEYSENAILFIFEPHTIRQTDFRRELFSFCKTLKQKGIPIANVYFPYKTRRNKLVPVSDYTISIRTVQGGRTFPRPSKIVLKQRLGPLKLLRKLESKDVGNASKKEYIRTVNEAIFSVLCNSAKSTMLVAGFAAGGCQRDFIKHIPELGKPPNLVYFPELSRSLGELQSGKRETPEERVKKWIGKSKRQFFEEATVVYDYKKFLCDL